MKPNALAGLLSGMILLAANTALAATDHSSLLKGPFATGPDVTKACLQCHQEHAQDFMKTVHWTWNSRQQMPHNTPVTLGKR